MLFALSLNLIGQRKIIFNFAYRVLKIILEDCHAVFLARLAMTIKVSGCLK
ncbi:MAG: hypothetical protein IJM09_01075 [Neisseriaceae bacterium]|nr:hypothetical protein [Neisseriaceae bacterium]